MIVGYARTSTIEQVAGFEAQLNELKSAGCEKIFQEQVSSVVDRVQLKFALEFVREGDVFVVTRLDRLVRTVSHLLEIIEMLKKKNVSLRILSLGMDTNTPTGKLMLVVLGAVGQFEREIMLERQREGIAKAQREGKFRGRKPYPKELTEKVVAQCQILKKAEVARRCGISLSTLYRMIGPKVPSQTQEASLVP